MTADSDRLCYVSQVEKLTELWEEHGGPLARGKEVLGSIATDFEDGHVAKARIARQLKALGLKRGALSSRQVCPFTMIKNYRIVQYIVNWTVQGT